MRMLPSAVPLKKKKHIMTSPDPATRRAAGAKKICRSPTKNALSRLRWIAYLTACLPTALALIPKLRSKSRLNYEVRQEDPPTFTVGQYKPVSQAFLITKALCVCPAFIESRCKRIRVILV